MPFVRSYYRRSAGSDLATAKTRHNLQVVVYDGVASTTKVKFRGPHTLRDLRFSTQLPGGFGQCSFTVTGSAARQWKIDTGHKVIVWDGRQIVWTGWVEDVQRGRSAVTVLALGPWEELKQLTVTATYTQSSDAIVNAALDSCSYVSDNRSHIQETGIGISGYTATRETVAKIVEVMCDVGNSDDQRMLFALWSPGSGSEQAAGKNLLIDGACEGVPDYDAEGWGFGNPPSSSPCTTDKPRTGLKSVKIVDASSEGFLPAYGSAGTWSTCSASTKYRLSFWVWPAATFGGVEVISVHVRWNDNSANTLQSTAGGGYLSSSTVTLAPADVTNETWNYVTAVVTSDASAARFQIECDIGGTLTAYFDDLDLRLVDTTDSFGRLPVPHFWPRDLTDYEYTLRGAGTEWQETTRELANYVVVTYGSSSATSAAEDGTSQTAYRRRDAVVAAGSDATQTMAEAQRDAYLAARKDPATELASSSWSYERITGELTDSRGRPVELARVRAGERIKIVDGEYAGSIVMIDQTEWRNGQLTITPERYAAVAELLARSV